jgi:hypothetical protein
MSNTSGIEQVHWTGFEWIVVSPDAKEQWYKIILYKEALTPREWELLQSTRPKVMVPPLVITDSNINELRKIWNK